MILISYIETGNLIVNTSVAFTHIRGECPMLGLGSAGAAAAWRRGRSAGHMGIVVVASRRASVASGGTSRGNAMIGRRRAPAWRRVSTAEGAAATLQRPCNGRCIPLVVAATRDKRVGSAYAGNALRLFTTSRPGISTAATYSSESQFRNHFPLSCGSAVTLLHDGYESFPAIYQAIDQAQTEIRLEMYWFESGVAGRSVSDRLVAASQRGVSVRVVYDSFGSMDADLSMFEEMRAAGCEVLEFNPVRSLWWPYFLVKRMDRITRRDHRKMIVVDDDIAFCGGMNIGDFWLPVAQGGEAWRDLMVRFDGPVVPVFAQIFDRLVGPLREGHDDRGALVDDGFFGGGGNQHKRLGNSKTFSPSSTDLVPGKKLRQSSLSLSNMRDKVKATVAKGRDGLTSSLFKRLSRIPKGTRLLIPLEKTYADEMPGRGRADGLNAESPNKSDIRIPQSPLTSRCPASYAWWSAQGRIKLMMAKQQHMLHFQQAYPDASATPSRYVRMRSRPSKLVFESVMAHWKVLGSSVQIITNDAWSQRNTIRRGYLRAIHAAKSRILIVNSYFVPCQSIRRALYAASERGVQVKIIVPGHNTDLQSVRWASHALYDRMLRKGIQLYEFLPSVLHTKLCIIDGQVSTVGSYNLDYRSWYHNLEIVAVIHDEAVSKSLEGRLELDIKNHCEKVELLSWSERPWLKKLSERFFYMFRHQM